jgi:hypothetical protein
LNLFFGDLNLFSGDLNLFFGDLNLFFGDLNLFFGGLALMRSCVTQGLARWEERYAGIGLEEDAIGDLVSVGGQVIAKGHELVAAAQKLQVGIGHFCKWLQKVTDVPIFGGNCPRLPPFMADCAHLQVALRLVSETSSTSISPAEALLVNPKP